MVKYAFILPQSHFEMSILFLRITVSMDGSMCSRLFTLFVDGTVPSADNICKFINSKGKLHLVRLKSTVYENTGVNVVWRKC